MTRVNELRDRISAWAARHHQAEVLEGMRCFLGDGPREDARVMSAIAFALIAPAPGKDALVERYAILPGDRPRAEREVFRQWARTEFSLFRVTRVDPEGWVDLHDVLRERALRVQERSAAKQLEVGHWLAAFTFQEGDRWHFEGSLDLVPDTARLGAVQGALRAYAEAGVDPRGASPADTRRVARATLLARHEAPPAPDAAGPDEPVDTLGGLTLRAALAQGRRAEVWALLPEDHEGDTLAATLGLAPPT